MNKSSVCACFVQDDGLVCMSCKDSVQAIQVRVFCLQGDVLMGDGEEFVLRIHFEGAERECQ